MEQYSATCPHCSFVLQFYDPSLFGRKGRCPKCHNKFILNKLEADELEPLESRLKPSPPAPTKTPSTTGKSAAQAEKKAPAPAASTAPAEEEQTWEMNMNRGLGIRRPTLSPRWVLPNVLAISTLLVIAVGAAAGMAAASLLLENCPVSLMAAAAAFGGTIAVAFRVRRYDPLRPKN